MPTRELSQQIMRHMHAPDEVDEEIYIRHVAIFVSVSTTCNNYAMLILHIQNYCFRGSLQDCVMMTNLDPTQRFERGWDRLSLLKKDGRR